MPNKPQILVQGATGQVGKNVIPHLIASDKVEVLAAARSPEKAKELGVPVVYLDLDNPESMAPALEGIDTAFLATGYTIDMMRQSKDFLNIAKKAGVKHIVHLGACRDNDTRVAHYAWHQFIQRYIEWCGFSFTHLRPEIFMQNLLGYGGENMSRTTSSGIISVRPDGAGLTLRMWPRLRPLPCWIRKSTMVRSIGLAIRLPLTIKLPRSSLRLSASPFRMKRARQKSSIETSWRLAPNQPT